jgi:hypothetical protein
MNYFIAFCILLSSSAYSSVEIINDLVSNRNMIVVTKKDNMFSYRYCEKRFGHVQSCSNYEGYRLCEEVPQEFGYDCKNLGNKRYYTEAELKKISKSEKTEAYLKVAGATVGALVTLYFSVGFVVGAASLASINGISPIGYIVLGPGTAVLFGGTTYLMFNPIDEVKEAGLLDNPAFQSGVKIDATPEQVKKASELLNNILN